MIQSIVVYSNFLFIFLFFSSPFFPFSFFTQEFGGGDVRWRFLPFFSFLSFYPFLPFRAFLSGLGV